MHPRFVFRSSVVLVSVILLSLTTSIKAQIIWEVGMDDNGWPAGDGGGLNATFVQEAGTNPPPGNPANEEINQQADDDYYFEGVYTELIPTNGDYEPVGIVSLNEEAAERAFAGTDNDLRYHVNLPADLLQTDLLSVTFDLNNLDTGGSGPRYGGEVCSNDGKLT